MVSWLLLAIFRAAHAAYTVVNWMLLDLGGLQSLTVVAYSRQISLLLIFYCLPHLRQVRRLRFRSIRTKLPGCVLPSSDPVPIPDQVPCSASRTRFRVSPAGFRVSQSESRATLGCGSRIRVSQQQGWILCWCVQCLSAPRKLFEERHQACELVYAATLVLLPCGGE